ncbi:MAG: Co2+/Mg2+ efflux protein ApaG [Bacteroidota bacterium]
MFSDIQSIKTDGVLVSVRTTYVVEQSSPHLDNYVFAYKIQIVNESSATVQLLRRRWVITDALGDKRVVEGDGVIGQQPTLAPGESHEYISGCDFSTPIGQMEGHYTMQRLLDDSEFEVRIPRFSMVAPFLLN